MVNFWMAVLLVLSLSLSSCDTLKQKFIRKKKGGEEDQNFVPVLEPEEYPNPQNNSEMNYKEQYGLIKAWYSDLWEAIDDKNTAKYIDYIISEVTEHIAKMENLVDGPTKAQLVKLSSFLDYYKSSLDYSWQARNVPRIRTDLIEFDRYLRDHLRVDKIQGHFIKPGGAAAATAATSAPPPANGAPSLGDTTEHN